MSGCCLGRGLIPINLDQVVGWHMSVEASKHPGATGFGWFFRYLTFYSFSLQFATLGLSCLSDITREVRH